MYFRNNEAGQFHFWKYIKRHQTFLFDSHWPFICSVRAAKGTQTVFPNKLLAKIKTGFSVHEKELCKTGEEKLMIAY
jgi:hypothetical protein